MQKFKYLVYSCYTAGLRFAEVVNSRGLEVKIVSHKDSSFNKYLESALPNKIIYFDDINEKALFDQIKAYSPNFIVSSIFNKKIPSTHFGLATDVAVNIHPSRLPDIRTGDSVLWNILLETNTFQMTMHKLTAQWDQGDILMQESIPVTPDETRDSMITKVEMYMKDNAIKFQNYLEARDYTVIPQTNGKYYPKFKQKQFFLSLQENPIFIEKIVRASGDEFKVNIQFKDDMISLLNVELTAIKSPDEAGSIKLLGEDLFLNTVSNQLKLNKLFSEKFGALTGKEFISLYKPKETDRFISVKIDTESQKIYDTWAKHVSV